MPEPTTADVPEEIFRVARRSGLLVPSRISPEDAALANAGNRFDVAGGGVLYCGTTEESCYAETLARFRPTPKMRDLLKDEKGFMVVGGVPQDWRLQRIMGTIHVDKPLPFLDVESPDSHAFLSTELASELVALGYTDNLDFADVCNRDRRLSRAIAQYAYTATGEDGSYLYSGIRYMSRINSDWECWAVFEESEIEEVARAQIELSDPSLQRIAAMWDLTVF